MISWAHTQPFNNSNKTNHQAQRQPKRKAEEKAEARVLAEAEARVLHQRKQDRLFMKNNVAFKE